MKVREDKPGSKLNIAAYIIIFLSIFLIGREIFHYFTLPGKYDVPEIIDLLKYKESTISQGFIWLLFFVFGIGLLYRNFSAWLIPQTFIIIGFAFFILFLFVEELSDISTGFIIIWIVYSIFSFFIFRYFIIGRPHIFFRILKQKIPYYYILALILTAIYWFIEFNT